MKLFGSLFLLVLAVVGVLLFLPAPSSRVRAQTATSGVGGELAVGATSIVSGKLVVPITTTAPVDPYSGFNLHLVWDPTLLSYASFDVTGSTLSSGSPLCIPAPDSGGAGAVVACSGVGSFSTTAAGLLVTYKLTPSGTPGCATLHLQTVNGADQGGSTFGSYTINAADIEVQANTYAADVQVPVSGGVCAPPTSTPTSSPTATNTPTRTPTSTPTLTPTSTATPISGAPDLVLGLFSSPPSGNSGSNVTYSAVIANQGTAPAAGVLLTFTLPPGGVLLGAGSCPIYTGGGFICPVGTLAANNGSPGGPDEIVVPIQARLPYLTGNANVVAQGGVSASNEPAGNQGNNTASVPVALLGCPDFNADNQVNALDLNLLAQAMLSRTGDVKFNPVIDLNSDGTIDGLDLSMLGNRYTQLCVGLDQDRDGVSDYDELNSTHTCPGLQPSYQSLSACHVGGNTGNPLIPNAADTDGDGLPDGVEVSTYGSNPLAGDTDLDFYGDGLEASLGKSPTIYCAIMAADLNMDGYVNSLDLGKMALSFQKFTGNPGFDPRADINRSGGVEGLDLNILAGVFAKVIAQCP